MKRLVLPVLIISLVFSCGEEKATIKNNFNYMDAVSFEVPKDIKKVSYREKSVMEDMYLKEYFEIIGTGVNDEEHLLYQKDMLHSYSVYNQNSYAFFIDVEDNYRLGSLYYFKGREGKGYKILETTDVFSVSPDFRFLIKAVNNRYDSFENEFKFELIKLPSNKILAEYDFYNDIENLPPYETATVSFQFSGDPESVEMNFHDAWEEIFASFTISLEDYSYKQNEIKYSKKSEPTPEDAIYVDKHSTMMESTIRIGNGNTRIYWDYPDRYMFKIVKRENIDSEFETVLSFPDTHLYLYNEEKKLVVIFHKDEDTRNRKNSITLLNLDTMEYELIGRGSFKAIMTENWNYLAYHEFSNKVESQLDYDSVIRIYDMRRKEIINTLDPNKYIPKEYLDPNVDYVAFSYPKIELLLTGVTEEDYLIAIDLDTERSTSIEVNQHPKQEQELPSIK